MIWKLLGLQKKLDALFDDGWVRLGVASERGGPVTVPAETVLATSPAQG